MICRLSYPVFLIALSMPAHAQGPSSTLPVLRFPLAVSLQTFDPTEAEDFVSLRVLLNIGMGLVRLDDQLRPLPGLATWKVDHDLRVIFTIKNSAKWSDGSPVTAQDFLRGLERSFNPRTVAKLAAPLLEVIKNASAYKSGAISDFKEVGIKARDARTVEFFLNHPAPYLLQLLALPATFPQKSPGPWKVGSPTCGPFVLEELKPEVKLLLSPNLFFETPPQIKVELLVVPSGESAANLFEKGRLDVLEAMGNAEYLRYKNDKRLVAQPFLATYYLGFNMKDPFYGRRAVRAAMAQAIDREDLLRVLQTPQHAASSWIPEPLPGARGKFGFEFNKTKAREAWEKLDQKKPLALSFDDQEKNNLIAQRLQAQLKENLQESLELKKMEWKAYLSYLTHQAPGFYRFAWLVPFPDPLAHLQVFTSKNPNNHSDYHDAEYDRLVQKVAETAPGKRRDGFIQQAQERLLTKDVVIIPLYHYVQYHLIGEHWRGIVPTPMGILYFHRAHREP